MKHSASREEELFAGAIERPASDRAPWLSRECADDAALLARLEALLQAHDEAEDFLETPRVDGVPPQPLPEEKPGERIGRYKLLQKIGEGGCGVVYMAEQEEPVRRRVALKVIKLGMDTKAVVARFEAERQALALMDHPGISRVFDGGATEQGRPYFVMELVRGVRITEFCDKNALSTRARLELFTQVCQAIQHAHQKGVIHRDIKPSNILVTLHDAVAVPKVIDFGIAKATQGRLTERTLFTGFDQFIGTPAYMSPEQAELTSADVDTRSDIYSLGVLLYELLTGGQPFDGKLLAKSGIDEIRRTIREDEPPRPSARLRTLPFEDLHAVAKKRDTGPSQLISVLRGDLDWIVMKALEKNRARRYETVNGLAADIGRHLRNEPVTARPPSAAYRLGKFIQRNRIAAVVLSIIIPSLLLEIYMRDRVPTGFLVPSTIAVALLVGLAVSRKRMLRARRAESEQAQMAGFMRRFVKNLVLLAAVEGDKAQLGRYLDQSAQGLDDELPSQPEMKAEVLETLGGISLTIGQLESAEARFAKALDLRRQFQGQTHPDVGRALNYLALVQSAGNKLAEAEHSLREARALQSRPSPTGAQDLPRTVSNLGWVHKQQGRPKEAEDTLNEALAMQRQMGESADGALTLKRLGFVHLQQGRLAEAEAELTEARDLNVRILGHDHLEVASSLNFLGVALAVQDEAPAKVLMAIKLYGEALAIRERLKASGGVGSTDRLSTMLSQQGTLAEIEVLLNELRLYSQSQHPADHWKQAYFFALSAVVLLEEHKFPEAAAASFRCHELRRKERPDDWLTFHAYCMWGAAQSGLKNFSAAEEPLLTGYEGMKQREQLIPLPHRFWLGRALQDLTRFYNAINRPDEAAKWTAELRTWAETYPQLSKVI